MPVRSRSAAPIRRLCCVRSSVSSHPCSPVARVQDRCISVRGLGPDGTLPNPHMGYFVSGRMKVVMDDGEEMEYGPGDFAIMAPGHDTWTVGDEACVVIDWQGFANYAKK